MIRRLLIWTLGLLAAIAAVIAATAYWFLSDNGIARALERQATAWLGQPVVVEDATAQLFPRLGIRLRNVRVGAPARVTLADVELSTNLRSLLRRRLEESEIRVSDSQLEMPPPVVLPIGGSRQSAGDTAAAVTLVSVRAITLRNIRILSRGREIVLSADSAFDGSQLRIARFTAVAGDMTLEASGTIDLTPSLMAKLDAQANVLDADDLLALVSAFSSGQVRQPSSMPGLGVSLKITAAKARVGGAPLTRFAAAVVNNGGNVRVDPFEFDAFGGHLSGWLDTGIGQTFGVNVQATVANLDVEQLAAFGGSAGAITGQLSGSVRLSSRGADLASALAAATGGGDARIGPGALRGLQLVRTVVLFFGRPASDAPASAGERFDDISATFKLANRMVQSDDLRMRSPDVDLLARGSLDLPNKALDARAELVLSESLSAQAGTDLYRYTRRGNRIVLPARIGGQLGQPRVSIDAGAAIKRGIENELQRRLERLFKP